MLESVSCKLNDNSALACSHLEIQYGVHLNHCKSILDLKGKANFDNEIKTGHVSVRYYIKDNIVLISIRHLLQNWV